MEEVIGGVPQTRRETRRERRKKNREYHAEEWFDESNKSLGSKVPMGAGILKQIEQARVSLKSDPVESELKQALEKMNSSYNKYYGDSEPIELKMAKLAESMNKMHLSSLMESENGSRIVFKDGQWMLSFQSVEDERTNKINLNFGK
tara:strand:+ start:1397 stop:1837 length:441 start_codon:yes stop_codon:yes gene_type:complete